VLSFLFLFGTRGAMLGVGRVMSGPRGGGGGKGEGYVERGYRYMGMVACVEKRKMGGRSENVMLPR
jgi:hypothetical protein